MDLQLNGRTALVTGSTAGIGRAIAALLAREGASVVVNGRSTGWVEAAVHEIRAGVADPLAAGAFGPGLPPSTPAGPAGGVGLVAGECSTFSLAAPGQARDNPGRGHRVARCPGTAGTAVARPPGWDRSTYPSRVGLTGGSGEQRALNNAIGALK
jgi:hypothetical protein